MKKRFTSIILFLLLCMQFTLTACGNGNNGSEQAASEKSISSEKTLSEADSSVDPSAVPDLRDWKSIFLVKLAHPMIPM